MTKRERLLIVALVVSFLGFSVFGAINPVEASYSKGSIVSEVSVPVDDDQSTGDILTEYYKLRHSSVKGNRMIEMLSSVLNMPTDEVETALSNGDTPRTMLANVGLTFYDLAEEFNFDVVGDREFVRFR